MVKDSNKQMIRFFTFSTFHNKRPVAGSTFIRVNQLIKHWPESDLYKYGEKPDVLIFQKVYATDDYQFPITYPGIKILDICDPDWLGFMNHIKMTVDGMDAVTCPTEPIAKFMRQLTNKSVKVIKDRFDLEVIPKPKQHTERAKTIAWFGYEHNAEILKPAISLIDEYKLNLLIISDQDPAAWRWTRDKEAKSRYKYKKYIEETFYSHLLEADFVVFPKGTRARDIFKSNNKTIKANLVGLPVATDEDEFRDFIYPQNRQKWLDNNYAKIKEQYDVRKSVEEYKELINELEAQKTKEA